jgi:lactate permease
MMSQLPLYLLSSLPIISLILLSLMLGVKKAALITFVLTCGLFFYWGAPQNYFYGAMASSFISTINILMIIAGAIFLYDVMQNAGLVKKISSSLDGIHPSKEIRFFLLAISLTAFFEGVAGFGTPGAIVPLLLIALGYNAVLAVSVVLLLNGLFAVFGAVGIPLNSGLKIPLNLTAENVMMIERYSAFIIAVTGYLIMWFIFKLYEKRHAKMEHKKKVAILYSFIAVPLVLFSFFAGELTTILAATTMMILSIIYLYRGKEKINLKPWLPYGLLILLMLLPKIIPALAEILAAPLIFENIFSSEISASFRPLQSPLIPFLIVGIGMLLINKNAKPEIKSLWEKILAVFVILFPTIAISQMMLHSGVSQPSMVNYIAALFGTMGTLYVFAAPFIGIAGAFITGSTTVSNIIFGASQLETSNIIGLNNELILSLQHAGASLGNAICLFNIIAAATIVGLNSYREVLKNNLMPTVFGGLLIGLIGMIIFSLI